MDDLDRLVAIEAIKSLKARYCRLLDTKAWDDFAALFTPDATIEIPELRPEALGVDALVSALASRYATSVSVHHAYLPEIEILGENDARAIWAMDDQRYFLPGKDSQFSEMIGSGHYHEQYVRGDGGWRIRALRLTRLRLEMKAQPCATI